MTPASRRARARRRLVDEPRANAPGAHAAHTARGHQARGEQDRHATNATKPAEATSLEAAPSSSAGAASSPPATIAPADAANALGRANGQSRRAHGDRGAMGLAKPRVISPGSALGSTCQQDWPLPWDGSAKRELRPRRGPWHRPVPRYTARCCPSGRASVTLAGVRPSASSDVASPSFVAPDARAVLARFLVRAAVITWSATTAAVRG